MAGKTYESGAALLQLLVGSHQMRCVNEHWHAEETLTIQVEPGGSRDKAPFYSIQLRKPKPSKESAP